MESSLGAAMAAYDGGAVGQGAGGGSPVAGFPAARAAPPGAGSPAPPLSAGRAWGGPSLAGGGPALRGYRSEPPPAPRGRAPPVAERSPPGAPRGGAAEALERAGVAAVRLKMLDEALARGVILGQGQRDELIGRLEDLGSALDAEVDARRLLEERRDKEWRLAESGAALAIEEEKRRRKDAHEGVIRVARAQMEAFRPIAFASMSPVRGIMRSAAEAEIRAVSRAIDAELEALAGKERALLSSFNAAVAALRERVAGERRRRQEDHAHLMETMSSSSQEILDALKVERRTRESTEEMLLGLLEGAVANVQSSLT